jgi:hypothetical protein
MRAQRSHWLIAVAATAALLSGCASSGPQVRSDYDKTVDFGKYRTYGFVTSPGGPDAPGYRSLAQQTAQEAASRQMEARGYRRSDSPDLVLNFTGKLEEKTDIESVPAPYYGPGWGYGGWYGAPYGGWGGTQVTTRRYNVGTLIMDVVDLQKRQVVFQGGIEGVVKKEALQNREAAISAAVGRIFEQYPFVAGQSAPVALPEKK